MKLQITSTNEITTIEGQPCRLWEGETSDGTPIKAWVRLVQPQTHDPKRLAAFDRQLEALPQLRPTGLDYRFFED